MTQLLSKIIQTGEWKPLVDAGITDLYFHGYEREIFRFINQHNEVHGKVPGVSVIKDTFTEFSFLDCEEPLAFYISKARDFKLHNEMDMLLEKISARATRGEVVPALQELELGLFSLHKEYIPPKDLDVRSNAILRYDAYLARKTSKGMHGIPTGIEPWDNVILGISQPQVMCIAARPKIGKTFLLMLLARNIHLQKRRPLVITLEMGAEELVMRYDAMVAGVGHHRFRSGKLTEPEEKQMKSYLESLPGYDGMLIVDNDEGEDGIALASRKIDEYKPDVLLIDGAYLMEFKGRGQYERLTALSRAMKKLAKRKQIPLIFTWQLNRETGKEDGKKAEAKPELDNLGFSDAIAQDVDVLLAMYQTTRMRDRCEMDVIMLAHRQGPTVDVSFTWDLDNMILDVSGSSLKDGYEVQDTVPYV